MAASNEMNGAATGLDLGDAKRRTVSGQQNGYIPQGGEQKLDVKAKKQVRWSSLVALDS